MNRSTLLLASVPCAVAALASQGMLSDAMRSWPLAVAAVVVCCGLLAADATTPIRVSDRRRAGERGSASRVLWALNACALSAGLVFLLS
ncbi:hypothetical protein [Uliginosibacterium sp. H1]|uniref:hypothetical protein n=1 Tax=Uliginosibacterium sp. H1 TaxID=3114757 RepID=UPI002E182F85|nr:hypothetical protein [Uliginosibacterium sp. H1]